VSQTPYFLHHTPVLWDWLPSGISRFTLVERISEEITNKMHIEVWIIYMPCEVIDRCPIRVDDRLKNSESAIARKGAPGVAQSKFSLVALTRSSETVAAANGS